MDIYVFDTSAFITLFRNCSELKNKDIWNRFNELVYNGKLISVREAKRELNSYAENDRLMNWVNTYKDIFEEPTDDEIIFVQKIFRKNHFQYLIKKQSIFEGKPEADPFIIAKAKAENACVVTQEKLKENASKIPNVCHHFGIDFINFHGFLEIEEIKLENFG